MSPARSYSDLAHERLVLREDVLLIPVDELDEKTRASLECDRDDIAVTRPNSRSPSLLLDQRGGRVLRHFEQPRRLVEAVILSGRSSGEDPEDLLEPALDLVRRMLARGFLAPVDPDGAIGPERAERPGTMVEPLLEPGDRAGPFRIARPIRTLEDSELYLAAEPDGRLVALKVVRPEGGGIPEVIRREAMALRRLKAASDVCPKLLAELEVRGCPAIAVEWISGVDVESAAARLRSERETDEGPAALVRLCRKIAEAYCAIHEQDVLHGDVHPSNLLVDREGAPWIIDFGLARFLGRTEEAPGDIIPRGGVAFYYDPEYAAALLNGTDPPDPTSASEQYALGAMLYQLFTGHHYLDFRLGREKLLRQVRDETVRSFEDRGVPGWPELEQAFGRALAKSPDRRFESVRAMADRLATLESAGRAPAPRSTQAADGNPFGALTDRVLSPLVLGGGPGEIPDSRKPPTASVNYGAAGIAFGLHRIATARDEPELLAAADIWTARAEADMANANALVERDRRVEGGAADAEISEAPSAAFYAPEIEITPEVVGSASPWHCPAGVYAIRARVARSMGDLAALESAICDFVEASDGGHAGIDLTLGTSGSLLHAALLLDLTRGVPGVSVGSLRELGDALGRELWRRLEAMPAISMAEISYVGIAHGWAGFLYALLHWARASGTAPPDGITERLEQLADLAEPVGRGLAWPWRLDQPALGPNHMPGWCNGSAGHVLLWTLAARVLEEGKYFELAEGAAWDTWDAPDLAASLCCGLVGRSYSLLEIHRRSGEVAWLDRACTLARLAAVDGRFEEDLSRSLYKGELALAVLAADLERPGEATFPFFGEEGW